MEECWENMDKVSGVERGGTDGREIERGEWGRKREVGRQRQGEGGREWARVKGEREREGRRKIERERFVYC